MKKINKLKFNLDQKMKEEVDYDPSKTESLKHRYSYYNNN